MYTDRDDGYGSVTARHYDGAYASLRDPSGDAAFYLELARAGFDDVTLYGRFDRTPPARGCPEMIFVARSSG